MQQNHHMLNEIMEIPDILTNLLDTSSPINAVAAYLKRFKPNIIYLAGRGSSYHAAFVGKYLIETFWNIPACIIAPSILTRYNGNFSFSKTLTLAISQSGKCPEVTDIVNKAKKDRGYTVAITNYPRSELGKVVDAVLPINTGREKAVPATKSYVASLFVLYILIDILTGKLNLAKYHIAKKIESVLKQKELFSNLASSFKKAKSCFVVGRGINFPVALEIALKLQECAGILACGIGAIDFLHGPIAALNPEVPVILIPTPLKDASISDTTGQNLTRKIRKTGSSLFMFPALEILEELSPLVYAVYGQLLAYYLALEKRRNPDSPKGLSKVTYISGLMK